MPTVETLSVQWREALDAAETAFGAAARCTGPLRYPADELRAGAAQLVRERADTEHVLEALARETRHRLHRHVTGPRATGEQLGIGRATRACVFDLDGVLTASATLHAAAWQETFDELLARHHESSGERFGPWRPFDRERDYDRYMHGRPRIEAIHAFLASRGIRLPDGGTLDPAGAETAWGLANRKQQALERRLAHDGVAAYDDSLRFLELLREAGLGRAVVSASTNTGAILGRAGLLGLVDTILDGRAIVERGLRDKPAPDWIRAACERLGVAPAAVACFETSAAGVESGRAAGAYRVIGVERSARRLGLADHGADTVVSDLGELIDPSL